MHTEKNYAGQTRVQTLIFCAIALVGCIAMATIGQTTSFDLNGDALGESAAAFKAHHPQAHCGRDSDIISYCEQQKDISFAGLKHSNLEMNGMYAGFYKDKMVQLSYFVDGDDTAYDKIVEAVTARIGKPSKRDDNGPNFHAFSWKRSDMTVTVTYHALTGVDISLSLGDDSIKSGF